MAAQLGNNRKAYICSGADDITSTTDAIWLGCETSNNINRSQEAIECSDKSDTWAKFIAAKRSSTFEVTVYADNGDPGQIEALKGIHVNEIVHFAVAVKSSDFEEIEYGDCIVTGVSDTNDFGAVSARTISLQATGPYNYYPGWDDEEEETEPAVPEDAAEEPVEEIPEEVPEEVAEEVEEPIEEVPEEVPTEEEPQEEPTEEE